MKIFSSFGNSENIEDSVQSTCIGAFDGVHLGHQNLIQKTKNISNSFQIVTFDKVPKNYFDSNHKLLSTNEFKSKIFSNFKPKNLIFLRFEEINQLSPEKFCLFLKQNLKTKDIFVGKDFKFGKNRSGDVSYLINYFGNNSIHIIDDFKIDNIKVSSTLIKNLLNDGNVTTANQYLGYEYEIVGNVIGGEKRGSTIGFPTANLNFDQSLMLPKKGVYKVKVKIDSKEFLGITNIGTKPTFNNKDDISLEVHILNFSNMIYGKDISVNFLKFIREEKKFSGVNELINQIKKDIASIN